MTSKKVTSRSAPDKGDYSYLSLYAKFISDNCKAFQGKWSFYEDLKVLYHHLEKTKSQLPEYETVLERFIELLEQKCDVDSSSKLPRYYTNTNACRSNLQLIAALVLSGHSSSSQSFFYLNTHH